MLALSGNFLSHHCSFGADTVFCKSLRFKYELLLICPAGREGGMEGGGGEAWEIALYCMTMHPYIPSYVYPTAN